MLLLLFSQGKNLECNVNVFCNAELFLAYVPDVNVFCNAELLFLAMEIIDIHLPVFDYVAKMIFRTVVFSNGNDRYSV